MVRSTIARKNLQNALQSAGYQYSEKPLPLLTKDKSVVKDAFIGVGVTVLMLLVLHFAGFLSIGDLITPGTKDFYTLLIVAGIGVVASLSTCMALVGGLVLSVSVSYEKEHPSASTAELMLPQLVFNLGRIIGFAILGALIGKLGALFALNGITLLIAIVIISVIMLMLGVSLTELSPRFQGFRLTLPAGITKLFRTSGKQYQHIEPFLLGVLSFFLPCGFTQVVQLFALSTGDALYSALIMMSFAIGTTPLLLGISSLGAVVKGDKSKHLFRALGVVIIGFSLFNIANATAPFAQPLMQMFQSSEQSATITDNVTVQADKQIVTIEVGGSNYNPYNTTVYAGQPIELHLKFTGFSCGSYMNLESIGLGQVFVDADKVLDVAAQNVGVYRYSCSMGMFNGEINVIEKVTDAKEGGE
jgi:sulfite exporter TauE/SafE